MTTGRLVLKLVEFGDGPARDIPNRAGGVIVRPGISPGSVGPSTFR
jgi:hypothetical protein